jgi:pimeloyl-ACP methyl ester carboxylesterase
MHTPKRALLTAAAALVAGAVALSITTASAASTPSAHHRDGAGDPKPTIVLVHGAWADGSSWGAVTSRLQHAGYVVDVVANPLRGVVSDARYLRDQLAAITGPVVLVGHSYGGMVITGAANPSVRALVYVDAYIPDDGDTVGGLTGAQPGSTLDPATSTSATLLHDADGNVIGADVYIKPDQFPGIFTGDISARTAAVLAASQRPLAFSALSEPFTGTPAWKTVPSWDVIGTADKLLPPAEQQIMAERAGAHIVKIDAPHLSMVADPDAVASVVMHAAQATG